MGSNVHDMAWVAGLCIPFVWLCHRLKVLTVGGGAMAGLIAMAVVVSQGWLWLVPLFVFLISGVLLGRLNKNARSDAKHGKPRDAVQVFCNGGIYAIAACLPSSYSPAFMMWTSVSVAMSDTWASELGMRFGGKPFDLATYSTLDRGVSGGITWVGCLGGVIGASLMGIVVELLFMPTTILTAMAFMVVFCGTVGTAGMLLDSWLGANMQARFDDGAGLRDQGSRRVSGFAWMTNDMVNLISNVLMVAAVHALITSL